MKKIRKERVIPHCFHAGWSVFRRWHWSQHCYHPWEVWFYFIYPPCSTNDVTGNCFGPLRRWHRRRRVHFPHRQKHFCFRVAEKSFVCPIMCYTAPMSSAFHWEHKSPQRWIQFITQAWYSHLPRRDCNNPIPWGDWITNPYHCFRNRGFYFILFRLCFSMSLSKDTIKSSIFSISTIYQTESNDESTGEAHSPWAVQSRQHENIELLDSSRILQCGSIGSKCSRSTMRSLPVWKGSPQISQGW